MAHHDVTIKVSIEGGEIVVSDDPLNTNRDNQDTIKWEKDPKTVSHFEVDFKDASPFHGKGIKFPDHNGKTDSDFIDDQKTGIHQYFYSVTAWPKTGGDPLTLDPVIIVSDVENPQHPSPVG